MFFRVLVIDVIPNMWNQVVTWTYQVISKWCFFPNCHRADPTQSSAVVGVLGALPPVHVKRWYLLSCLMRRASLVSGTVTLWFRRWSAPSQVQAHNIMLMQLRSWTRNALNLYTLKSGDCLNRAMNQWEISVTWRQFRPWLPVSVLRFVPNNCATAQQTQSYILLIPWDSDLSIEEVSSSTEELLCSKPFGELHFIRHLLLSASNLSFTRTLLGLADLGLIAQLWLTPAEKWQLPTLVKTLKSSTLVHWVLP